MIIKFLTLVVARASCAFKSEPKFVTSGPQRIPILFSKNHPNFRKETLENDIIILSSEIAFEEHIPVCMAKVSLFVILSPAKSKNVFLPQNFVTNFGLKFLILKSN